MTNLVMVMPYRQFVTKAQQEGLRVFAIWDRRVAEKMYGADAENYLRDVERFADGFALTDFTDEAEFERVVRAAVDDFDADYVYHVGAEDSMLAAYRLAERLGRTLNPASSIEALNDKLAMRRLLREHGVSTVRFAEADRWQDVAGLLNGATGFELPVVVKPTQLSGSRGVYLLRHRGQLAEWGALLDSYGYRGPVLVEEYLSGPEFSVETQSENGRHRVVGVTRKLLGPPPLFIEAGHVHPAPEPATDRIAALAVELLDLAGYRYGPAHTEIILTEAGPKIVESQARLGGDRIPRLIELVTGLDFERATFQVIAGRPLEVADPHGVATISYFDLPTGRLRSVAGLDEIRALDFVSELSFLFRPGDEVPETVDWKSRHGYVILTGDSAEQAAARVHQVRSLLRVDVEPAAPSSAVA